MNKLKVRLERRNGRDEQRGETRREVRAASAMVQALDAEGAPPKVGGYAAVFNSPTVIYDYFREQIAPGAFANALGRDDVRALFNHDPNYVLGRNKAGTLTLAEDSTGLQFEATPPDTAWSQDLIKSVRRGDINQCSFGFISLREQWDETGDMPLRTILEAELLDVSIVTYPAYEDTSVAVRSLEGWRAASGPPAQTAEQIVAQQAASDQAASGAIAARLRMKQGLFGRGIRA